MKWLSTLFLILGAVLFITSAYLLYLRVSPHPISFEKRHNFAYTNNLFPTEIAISSIGANLPVIPSHLYGNSWETTTLGVSYLTSTPIPGEKGNSVFYGHNWKSLLGSLPNVKPGNEILIKYRNNLTKKFTVEYTAVVNPNQMDVINNTNDTRITIYTCTGFLDSKRFVVVAKPSV